MKFLAKIFGKRMTATSEYCHIEAYFWLGRLYYTRFDTFVPVHPVSLSGTVAIGSPGSPGM
jgi:hypothetical protein